MTKLSKREVADIPDKLKETAKKYTSSAGARKTTVDQLCRSTIEDYIVDIGTK